MSTPGQHGFGEQVDPGADEEYEVTVPEPGAGLPRWQDSWQGPPPAPMHERSRPAATTWPDASPSSSRGAAGGGRSEMPTAVWWGLGSLLAVGLVILLLVVGGVFTAKNDEEPGSQATGQYQPPGPSDPGGHNLRIIDKDSGISYDYLGEGWKDWSMGVMLEYQTLVGEYIITQPTVPSGGEFIAQVTSGLLTPGLGGPDPGGFPAVLEAVEGSVRSNYYPQPNTPTNQADTSLTVDGHQAYQRSMDLTWDVEGYDSTGERVVLLLIDTGKSAPVFFYCSFPNTHAELYPLIEQVIASIKVDQ